MTSIADAWLTQVRDESFDKQKETARPFRLYNAKEKSFMPWRHYLHRRNAHLGALIECRWSEIGTCIELVDITKGKLIGQYVRRVNDIQFFGE